MRTLGCPKNRVDSEVMLGTLADAGYRLVEDAARADVIVVNTCGFIASAKEESVSAILELAQQKAEGRCKKLVVAGCLTQRYHGELAAELPAPGPTRTSPASWPVRRRRGSSCRTRTSSTPPRRPA